MIWKKHYQITDWNFQNSGGNIYFSYKDITLKDGTTHAVGITDEAVVVYNAKVDDESDFTSSGELFVFYTSDNSYLNNELQRVFLPTQVNEILELVKEYQSYYS